VYVFYKIKNLMKFVTIIIIIIICLLSYCYPRSLRSLSSSATNNIPDKLFIKSLTFKDLEGKETILNSPSQLMYIDLSKKENYKYIIHIYSFDVVNINDKTFKKDIEETLVKQKTLSKSLMPTKSK
jgi:hypothetical protein